MLAPLKVNLTYFVVEIVMQNIKEQALVAYTQTILLWSPYVGNTFTTAHKDEIDNNIFMGTNNIFMGAITDWTWTYS